VPIRSPRGRAAAYRAVWSWPLRSPLRFAATAVVVIAVVVLVSFVLGGRQTPSSPTAQNGTVPTTGVRSPSSLAPTALPPVAPLTPTTLPLSAYTPRPRAATHSGGPPPRRTRNSTRRTCLTPLPVFDPSMKLPE